MMTSQEMMRTKLPPGYWFWNVSLNGEKPDWRIQPMPPENRELLFGYPEKEFLAKQYR